MKAALCKSLDGPAALVLEDLPSPKAGTGEVVVRVHAAALNFFDTLITRGKYQHKPELPFSPSGEIAGVIAAVGPGVEDLMPGMRVACYLGWGGAREEVAVAAESCVPIPDAVDDVVASGIAITYGTAIHGLRDRARLQSGETVAVLGASGGAGLAAVEIAKLMGARVIAVASSPEKLAVAQAHGADVLVDYAAGDLKAALKDATGGDGVDVIYDCVGGPSSNRPCVRSPGRGAISWSASRQAKSPSSRSIWCCSRGVTCSAYSGAARSSAIPKATAPTCATCSPGLPKAVSSRASTAPIRSMKSRAQSRSSSGARPLEKWWSRFERAARLRWCVCNTFVYRTDRIRGSCNPRTAAFEAVRNCVNPHSDDVFTA